MPLFHLLISIICVTSGMTDADPEGKFDFPMTGVESRGPHSFDVLHYDLSLELFEGIQELGGVVGVTFTSQEAGLDQIMLDIIALSVSAAWDASGALPFVQLDSTVVIDLSAPLEPGESGTVWVAFSGSPSNNGLSGFFWYDDFGVYDTHYSVGMEPISGSWIFPCWDDIYDKASIDAHITVSDSLFAASCGELVSVEPHAGTTTYNWSHPQDISLYVWALVVSEYIVVPDETYGWIKYYTMPEYVGMIEENFGKVHLMLDCFEESFGEYPWGENLGFPFVYAACGCEHNTLPFVCVDLEDVVAHEVAHQWWGNFVTEASWPEIWLSEGLAQYSRAVWEGWEYGHAYYHAQMYNIMHSYLLSGELFPIVPAEEYWSSTTYNKGASVIHMLRHVTGETVFWNAIQGYLADNAYESTTTEDLQASFESAWGQDLDWFFDTWVYDWGYPDYLLSWTSQQAGSDWELEVTIEQVQTVGPVFTMPVDLLVGGTPDDSLVVMWNDQQLDTEVFTLPFQPLSVTLDPGNWILRAGLTGIEDPGIPPVPDLTVFPNPARGWISVGWLHQGEFTARIYDMAGRCVLEADVSVISPLVDISGLPSGSYRVVAESFSHDKATGAFTVLTPGSE
jgi:aminopeptidase N